MYPSRCNRRINGSRIASIKPTITCARSNIQLKGLLCRTAFPEQPESTRAFIRFGVAGYHTPRRQSKMSDNFFRYQYHKTCPLSQVQSTPACIKWPAGLLIEYHQTVKT